MGKLKSLFLILIINHLAFGGEIILQEDIDDFDDDARISIAFMEDSHNTILERMVIIQCDTENMLFAIKNGLFFSLLDRLKVKVRFDKKEAFEENLFHVDGLALTDDKKYIKKFLEQASTSSDMVLKVEDNDHLMRFSNFGSDQQKAIQFIEKINSYDGCRLN